MTPLFDVKCQSKTKKKCDPEQKKNPFPPTQEIFLKFIFSVPRSILSLFSASLSLSLLSTSISASANDDEIQSVDVHLLPLSDRFKS